MIDLKMIASDYYGDTQKKTIILVSMKVGDKVVFVWLIFNGIPVIL